MARQPQTPDVGSPDPEQRNSPIMQPMDEERPEILDDALAGGACYFNGKAYPAGSHVRSGPALLRCVDGVWEEVGPSDPDNP